MEKRELENIPVELSKNATCMGVGDNRSFFAKEIVWTFFTTLETLITTVCFGAEAFVNGILALEYSGSIFWTREGKLS